MDRIQIQGLEGFGHHGVLAHEREYGQRFVVDLSLELDLGPAAGSDDLADTVDYGRISREVLEIVTGEPVDLIEALASRIAARCLDDDRVIAVEVTVHKPAAPVPVVVRDVSVTLRRSRPSPPSSPSPQTPPSRTAPPSRPARHG